MENKWSSFGNLGLLLSLPEWNTLEKVSLTLYQDVARRNYHFDFKAMDFFIFLWLHDSIMCIIVSPSSSSLLMSK